MANEFYLKKSNFQYDVKNQLVVGNQLDEPHALPLQVVPVYGTLFSNDGTSMLKRNQKRNEESENESESWKAFYKHWELSDNLEKDVKTSIWDGEVKTDSVEMQFVKNASSKVTDFMLKTEISIEKGAFLAQKDEILRNYGDLIRFCQFYVDRKKRGWWLIYHGEGYRRYELVKKTLARARSEKNKLEHRADRFFHDFQNEESNERPLWINILADCRTSQLDLNKVDKGNIRHVGGNCSDVIEITQGEKKGYIKETTYNHTLQKKCDQYIDRVVQSGLGQLFPDQIKSFLKMISEYFTKDQIAIYIRSGVSKVQIAQGNNESVIASLKELLKGIRRNEINSEKDDFIKFLDSDDKRIDSLILDFWTYYIRNKTKGSIAKSVAKIAENANITNRNVATYRLAELLGIPDLIPAVTKVKFQDEKKMNHQGILLEDAKGMKWYEATNNKLSYNNAAYIQLNSLQILDTLTGQVDRNGKNCIMENSSDTSIGKITGIDNDLCFGNLSYEDYTYDEELFEKSGRYINPIENENGITLKLIDKKVYDGVLALDDDLVKYAFADLLTRDEMKFFLNRIHGVQELFRKIPNERTVCIYDPITTNNKTIERARNLQKKKRCYYRRKYKTDVRSEINPAVRPKSNLNRPNPDFKDYK